MTTTQHQMIKAGYVVCPNNPVRMYHACGQAKRFPLCDVLVTDRIQIVNLRDQVVDQFATVPEFLAAVETRGEIVPAGPNVWD